MTGLTEDGRSRIQEVARAHLANGWHTGAQVAVYRHGQLEANLALGDGADRRMLWFSATKPVTAVAVHILVERGLLDLDTPIADLWPEFGQGGKATCTTRHVLTHQGGFPVFPPDFNWDRMDDWSAVTAATAALPALWPPGTDTGYHPVTYGFALGEVIRRADPAHREPRDFLREEIFAPLGMDASLGLGAAGLDAVCMPRAMSEVTLADPEGVEARTTDIVRRFSLPATLRGQLPAANGIGTAEALARFYAMLVNGGELDGTRILQRSTVEAITRVHVTADLDRTSGLPSSYGLGFAVGGIWPPFDTPGVFGHGGQQCAICWGDPDTGIAAAYITNGLHDPYVVQVRTEEMFHATREACA